MSGSTSNSVTAVATRVSILADASAAFVAWQAQLTHTASAAPGFVSIELAPSCLGSSDWQIIQRFRTAELLTLWCTSQQRADLFARLVPLQAPALPPPRDEATHAFTGVTEVITTNVAPGKEEAFFAWAEAVQTAQAGFPGYMGTLVQAPLSAGISYWTALVRFATTAELDAWLGSAERKCIIATAAPEVATWKSQRLDGPFEGWFTSDDTAPAPAAWKQTALVLLVLYPVVMVEIKYLSPHLASLPAAVATFVGNAISVALVSWPLMSGAAAALGWWLRPAPARRATIEVLGASIVLALYAAEILGFGRLF